MKKFLFLILVLSSFSAHAVDIQGRAAYLFPQDDRMRQIYGHGWWDYELQVDVPLKDCCGAPSYLCGVSGWCNLSFYEKKGHTHCLRHHTNINSWAMNFGVSKFFDCGWCLKPYLGIGIGAGHAQFHDKSPYVHRDISRWGFSALAKSGVQYEMNCNWFIDLFADYAYNHIGSKKPRHGTRTHKVNVGGGKLGIGIGYHL